MSAADLVTVPIVDSVHVVEDVLLALPPIGIVGFFVLAASFLLGPLRTVLPTLGLLLIWNLGLWDMSMHTLSLVIVAVVLALAIGIPLGFVLAENVWASRLLTPFLDFLQTMPRFVYLIPAVAAFGIGSVPAVLATITLTVPPTARLTSLGIREVNVQVIEAGVAFGCSPLQLLTKIKLPLAMPAIVVGVNQSVLLALSMVVIASLIGAGGLGDQIVQAVYQLRAGDAVTAGLAVVILALIIDRLGAEVAGRVSARMSGQRFDAQGDR